MEVVITLLLLGVLSAFIGRPLISLVQTHTDISDAAEQRSEIEHALSRMAKEIRLSDDSTNISMCETDGLTVNGGGNEIRFKRNDSDALLLNGAILVSNARVFECTALEPESLRLYELVLNDLQIRVFKRDS